jgi:hypothetical protein
MTSPAQRLARVLALVGALGLGWSPSALAAELSELAGSWVKDVKLSDAQRNGQNPAAEATLTVEGIELKIDQTVHAEDGPRNFKYSYIADGQPHPARNPFFQGAERDVTAEWKSGSLVVKWTQSNGPVNVDVTETWKLKGRDKIEIKRVFDSPVGSFTAKTVFRRQ